MTENDQYKIQGFISILKTAPPNGRYCHLIANKLTALNIHLSMQRPISYAFEQELKQLVRRLYENNPAYNSYTNV